MLKKYVSLLLITLFSTQMMLAQSGKSVTDLPNISVIGNMIGTHQDSESDFTVKEIELSFQHYLYPSVKADVFTALHKEESGERNFELEEAYVTFSDVNSVFFPNNNLNLKLAALVGKKKASVGKSNPLHPEQWQFVDRPLAMQQFLGGEEGLAAEGLQLNYLLPIPFFSQLEVAYGVLAAHDDHDEEEEGEEEEAHGMEYEGKLLNTRLWNSFQLSENQEFEVGLNYVLGNASASSDDQQQLIGTDLTLTKELNNDRYLKLQAEYYQATYGEEGEDREDQTGGYLSLFYKLNSQYKVGARFGQLSAHGDEGEDESQFAVMLTRQLTETSKFRLQYNSSEHDDNTLYVQFIFGMGPHSHVLQ
ncbi:hypothetical protein DID76_04100 [Candidatus Marinamargulisbacteria bacterium SCGC AG-414-C22]|nr:hypothetical protein DID76_04100 [Candidatus Marinamargulisbacteria bacterium SCGC AG-414-C22]